ncbi:hypothetical protein ACFSUS_21420 [Spirosoma soli]|uniref:Uncharacterized protein n=1 Tax=Spirosoma soli TaxID=1770529 RepID=A0ABW5MCF4_9BACT
MKLDNSQLALINAGMADNEFRIDVHYSEKDGWYAGGQLTIKF